MWYSVEEELDPISHSVSLQETDDTQIRMIPQVFNKGDIYGIRAGYRESTGILQ